MFKLLMGFSWISCASAQVECSTADLMNVQPIVETCCESVAGNCGQVFPPTCTHSCARLVVPYIDSCRGLLEHLPNEVFSDVSLHIPAFLNFSEACRQTLTLFESARRAGPCDSGSTNDALQSRVDAINQACCEQQGVNTCVGGAPQVCDAECAMEFLPYWHDCLSLRTRAGDAMQQFTLLFTACTDDLSESEVMELYRDVTVLDDARECFINTSMILSRTEAKQAATRPPCDHNAFGAVCDGMISSGFKSCAEDYCELCPEAHSCDGACQFPCGPGDTNGGHRMQRILAEIGGWASALVEYSVACPLEQLHERIQEVDAACCGRSNGVCAYGVPTSCSYRCGRVWTSFFANCEAVLSELFDGVEEYEDLTASCLDVDPMSVTLALDRAVCSVCGDGVQGYGEECDEGQANSDLPNALCRTNCKVASCGDGIVDDGETCDGDGMVFPAPITIHSEVGAEANGWTNDEITEAMPDREGSTGLVHGPWGNDVADVEIDIDIPIGVERCEITWTSWSIDSRDGEADRLLVSNQTLANACPDGYTTCGACCDWNSDCRCDQTCDGATFECSFAHGTHSETSEEIVVWEKRAIFPCERNRWDSGPRDFVQHWNGNEDDVCFLAERVVVPCFGRLHVHFQSDINQDENDEAWAFSDFVVRSLPYPIVGSGCCDENCQDCCAEIDPSSYVAQCRIGKEGWDRMIDMSCYDPNEVCNVLVRTNGSTCADYCASQGLACMHAQDNDGYLSDRCEIVANDNFLHYADAGTQDVTQNGCLMEWGDQMCGCGK
eukprot:SAG31_NODE_2264_length_6057_cov_6.828634_2_plen_781_part_00